MKKSEIPYQAIEEVGGCGPRALYYVYTYFGHPVSQRVAAQEMGTSEAGTPIPRIVENLTNRGLHVIQWHNSNWSELSRHGNDDKKMVIVNWWSDFDSEPEEDCGHYSCVESVNRDVVTLIGEGMVNRQGFENRWHDKTAEGILVKGYMMAISRE